MVSAMTEQPQKKKGILERLFLKFMANWQEVKAQHQRILERRNQSTEQNEATEKEEYECPQCGQSCTKEEYESGFCLDCDTVEMGI